MTRLAILSLSIVMTIVASPVGAQDDVRVPRDAALRLAPAAIRYTLDAADSILASTHRVSLEAFRGDTVTGVFLDGTFGGEDRSIGYGADPLERRYLWFSVGRGDTLDYVVMLYDVDLDLRPDFLLFRTIDARQRAEFLFEYRSSATQGEILDIQVNPACRPPRCDPARWTVHERQHFEVPPFWFEPWRPLFALAATRGERWLGEGVRTLPFGVAADSTEP